MNEEFSAPAVAGLERTLPSSWYYSEDTFQLEKERIFCREWFCAGREEELCSGPGNLTQALGVELAANGSCLASGPVRIGERPREWRDPAVVVGTRIGISRAVELPWRFCAADDPHVSRPRPRR